MRIGTAGWLLVVLALLAVPLTTATVQRSPSLDPVVATPSVSSAHLYQITLQKGQTVSVALFWENPRADLDLRISPTRGICERLPVYPARCLSSDLVTDVLTVTCLGETQEGAWIGLGPDQERVDHQADSTDIYLVAVLASTGIPGDRIPYELTITADGSAEETIHGPKEVTVVRHGGHCRDVL